MDSDPEPPKTTTVPDEPSVPPPSAKPEATTPPIEPDQHATALQRLRVLLYRFLSRLAHSSDRTLIRLASLLSTPSGIDSMLCTVGYTLTLLHTLLSKVLERRLATVATNLAEKADSVLLPGETLIATLPAPASTKLMAQVVGSSKALADTMADYRIFARLWGLAGLYPWAKSTWLTPLSSNANGKEKLLRGITWAEIGAVVIFQVLENGAYLASKGALTSGSWAGDAGKAKETRWWVWSSRWWSAQVTLELVRLGLLWGFEEKEEVANDTDGEKEGKMQREETLRRRKQERWLWRRDLVSNVAYFPMTLHWSVEEGLLSETSVAICGLFAGGVMLIDNWRKAA